MLIKTGFIYYNPKKQSVNQVKLGLSGISSLKLEMQIETLKKEFCLKIS
jgi:hypothetical protein